jgi:hypothetical protein
MKATQKQASIVARKLGVILPIKLWTYAVNVELEHTSLLSELGVKQKDYILFAGKIALAHLLEFPDYYQRLKELESEAEKYWKVQKSRPLVQK